MSESILQKIDTLEPEKNTISVKELESALKTNFFDTNAAQLANELNDTDHQRIEQTFAKEFIIAFVAAQKRSRESFQAYDAYLLLPRNGPQRILSREEFLRQRPRYFEDTKIIAL